MAWHGEDETPGVDVVLEALGHDLPKCHGEMDWTFSLISADLPRLAAYLADRLDWPSGDRRRPALFEHLSQQAEATDLGFRLPSSVARRFFPGACDDCARSRPGCSRDRAYRGD
ncbi:MAG TPA: hypothetical protein VGC51_13325 [Hansschlegelia sp.]